MTGAPAPWLHPRAAIHLGHRSRSPLPKPTACRPVRRHSSKRRPHVLSESPSIPPCPSPTSAAFCPLIRRRANCHPHIGTTLSPISMTEQKAQLLACCTIPDVQPTAHHIATSGHHVSPIWRKGPASQPMDATLKCGDLLSCCRVPEHGRLLIGPQDHLSTVQGRERWSCCNPGVPIPSRQDR